MTLAIDAISSGRAECVAIIYGNAYRSSGRQFGGPNAVASEAVLHYYWYRPWGFTSQGAFDSVVVQRYMEKIRAQAGGDRDGPDRATRLGQHESARDHAQSHNA
jgi:hypothetical protein